MDDLFTPVAPRLRQLAAEFGAMAEGGGAFHAQAADSLHDELLDLAIGARAEEALACAEEVVSRRLFAIAGAFEKHIGGGCAIGPVDAGLLCAALRAWADALDRLPLQHLPDEGA